MTLCRDCKRNVYWLAVRGYGRTHDLPMDPIPVWLELDPAGPDEGYSVSRLIKVVGRVVRDAAHLERARAAGRVVRAWQCHIDTCSMRSSRQPA